MIRPQLLLHALMRDEETEAWTTEEERATAALFGSVRRRQEYLTWRAVLRQTLGVELKIAYNESGAPILPDRAEYISVSHSGDRVAVAISHRPTAIDLERLDRRFGRILSKYLTPQEQTISSENRFHAAAWCAKETAYKWAGIRDLAFEEVEILGYDNDRITLRVRECDSLCLAVEQLDEEYIMTYIV